MKAITILSLVVLAIVANQVLAGQVLFVTVSLGGGHHSKYVHYHDLDDQMTVRQLAEQCMQTWKLGNDTSEVRMEGHLGLTYNMDKTLEEAGVKDDAMIKLKNWSRVEDVKKFTERVISEF